MIGSSRSLRVFAYTGPVDMRKGFDGLYGMVSQELKKDPLSGELFLFVSRDRKRAKVLLWDGTGLCLYCKRLEKGRFAKLWGGEETPAVELTTSELSLFLEGSRLVGKVPISPEKMCLKCLTGNGLLEKMRHVEAGGNHRSTDPPADGNSPRKAGHQAGQADHPAAG